MIIVCETNESNLKNKIEIEIHGSMVSSNNPDFDFLGISKWLALRRAGMFCQRSFVGRKSLGLASVRISCRRDKGI